LDTPEAAHILEECKSKQIKNLIKREKQQPIYKKIGSVLEPNLSLVLVRVDIPDPNAKGAELGSPTDPKTWKGPWISVTNPEDIARNVCTINIKQYNQAVTTPFGSGPLAEVIGRNGDTPTAKALLEGTLPATILSDLMPETVRILQTLAIPTEKISNVPGPIINDDEFISTFKVTNEATSSSPSGHHIGHYRAILKDPLLVSLHTTMMSIPFQVGFAPDRWTRVTDIMLEKDVGTPRCHRLRILALFEGDFNQAKRIVIARRASHHIDD
jgi:hypothetical protein